MKVLLGVFSLFAAFCDWQLVQAATITSGFTTSSPSPVSTVITSCKTPTRTPFDLYVLRDNGTTYPVRLLKSTDAGGSTVMSMIVSTNNTCTNCGSRPSYWNLQKMVLSPVLPPESKITYKYLDLPVDASTSPSFLVTTNSSPTYPIYCADPSGLTKYPYVLAVNGTPNEFTMCAWTSIVPYPTQFEIIYKRANIQPVGVSCFPVKLIMVPLFSVDPPLPSVTLL